MAKDDLLAVAFTDLNGNDKYNPGKDTLIAALVDTNNDNIPSVGDTVQWGTYPKIPDGSASGTGGQYQSLFTTVLDVDFITLDDVNLGVRVETGAGTVQWLELPSEEQFSTVGFGGVDSILTDNITLPMLNDTIFADNTVAGAGMPNNSVDISVFQPGDQAFLDVHLLWF
jgi:hypothetical protein